MTIDADRMRANPSPAVRTTFDARNGELSIAVTARSARSKVDHVMDPVELPLNWTPIQGSERTVPFDWKMISEFGWPFATRVPSTNRPIDGWKRTVVFGRIVRVTRGATVTWFVTMYRLSVWPHVVSTRMTPETYVVAEALGLTATRPANEIRTIARTVRALCVRGFHRTGDMATDTPVVGGKSVAASLLQTLY